MELTKVDVDTLRPFLSGLKVRNRFSGEEIPLVLNSAQERVVRRVEEAFRAEEPCRLLLLRDRQVGQSTICLAIMAWLKQALVVACDGDTLDNYAVTLRNMLPHRATAHNRVGEIEMFASKYLGIGREQTYRGAYLSDVDTFSRGMLFTNLTLAAVPRIAGTVVILSGRLRAEIPKWFLRQWEDSEIRATLGADWVRLYLDMGD